VNISFRKYLSYCTPGFTLPTWIALARILLLCVAPSSSTAQLLGLQDLIQLQQNDFVKINDLITSKGWEFSHSKKSELDKYNTVSWAYQKNDYGEAIGWLTLYTDEGSENILSYQIHSGDIYNAIKNQISSLGMRVINSSIKDNEISSVFQGKHYTITITITSDEDNANPQYLIGLLTNQTYSLAKISKFLENMDQSDNASNDQLVKEVNSKYGGSFIYKSLAYSYAPIFTDIGLTERIYMVPPEHYVYIINELRDNKLRVFCNGKHGYMDIGMLRR
jgi:hypothetical protein